MAVNELGGNKISQGEQAYRNWRENFLADPENRRVYEEEAAKKELWLQLVEARQTVGLTQKELAGRIGVSQAQVARMEKSGYSSYTLNSLRHYLAALGNDYVLNISVERLKNKAS
jgi:DNA-binding XRE family transcriptional regulator